MANKRKMMKFRPEELRGCYDNFVQNFVEALIADRNIGQEDLDRVYSEVFWRWDEEHS